SLPRLASSAAFLCLVVAHLEWPAISAPYVLAGVSRGGTARDRGPLRTRADDVDEHAVHPRVAADLRVERGGEQGALSSRHDPTGGGTRLHACQDLDVLTRLLDPGCPDVDGAQRPLPRTEIRRVDVLLEGVDLPPEGVAPHRDVHPADDRLGSADDAVGEEHHAGARAVDGQPGADEVTQVLEEVEGREQGAHRRRLAAGEDEAVDGAELGRPADAHRACSGALQGREVLGHVALECEDADRRCSHEPPAYAPGPRPPSPPRAGSLPAGIPSAP